MQGHDADMSGLSKQAKATAGERAFGDLFELQSSWHEQSLDQAKYSKLVSRWHDTFVGPTAEFNSVERRFEVSQSAAEELQDLILTEVFVNSNINLPPKCSTILKQEVNVAREEALDAVDPSKVDPGLKNKLPRQVQQALEQISADRHIRDIKALLVQEVMPRLRMEQNRGTASNYLTMSLANVSKAAEVFAASRAQVQHLYRIYEHLRENQREPFEDAFPANLKNSLCQKLNAQQLVAVDHIFRQWAMNPNANIDEISDAAGFLEVIH